MTQLEEAATIEAEEEKPLNAVIIVKTGDITAEAILNGNVDPLQAQTLIELGLKAWRQKLGLD